MTIQMKDWLGYELNRNKEHADVYVELMQRAIGKLSNGCEVQVLIGHHLTFELNSDLTTENEIPSADCLMFDHDIMKAVFGDNALPLMMRLVCVPCDKRDAYLGEALSALRMREQLEVQERAAS